MQMKLTISENKEELFGKKCGRGEDSGPKKCNAARNQQVQRAQFSFVVAPREGRYKDIRQHVHHHGKDHCQATKRPNFGNGIGAAPKKAEEKDGDLSLKTVENRAGGKGFD